MRHRLSQAVTLLALAVMMTAEPAHAKEKQLIDLSIEELMHLDVIQVTVPGAHFHFKGDWMVGAQMTQMNWNGLGSGTGTVSPAQVLPQYMMAETTMQQNMTMLDVMYGLRDDWTIMACIPQMNMTMNQVFPDGSTGINSTSGLGDVSISIIHPFKYHYPTQLEGELGIGLPTGDTKQFGFIPFMFSNQKLPYNMQLGSGSFTLQPAVTWLGQTNKIAWGAQARGYLPLNTNGDGYVVPDSLTVTGWVAPHVNKLFSPSLRLDYVTWGSLRGNDPIIDFTMMPSSNPANYGGTRADVFVGLNFAINQDGEGHGQWITVEGGWPFYQNLNGIQMRLSSIYNAAFQWTFK